MKKKKHAATENFSLLLCGVRLLYRIIYKLVWFHGLSISYSMKRHVPSSTTIALAVAADLRPNCSQNHTESWIWQSCTFMSPTLKAPVLPAMSLPYFP
jgi:hypothetical protein